MNDDSKTLYAPDGTEIVGTYDMLPGHAKITGATRNEDGSIEADFASETEVWWDSQETQVDDRGERLWVDRNYSLWPESLLHLEGEEPKAMPAKPAVDPHEGRCITVRVYGCADPEGLAMAIEKLVGQRAMQSGHVSLLGPEADFYVVEAEDWAVRYEGDERYDELDEEGQQAFVAKLRKLVPQQMCSFSDVTWEAGALALDEVLEEREAKQPAPEPRTAEGLEARYGREHPDWPATAWAEQATAGETRLGYWQWVAANLEGE